MLCFAMKSSYIEINTWLERDDIEINVTIGANYTPGLEAQLYGAWENCHPSEPSSIDIIEVFDENSQLTIQFELNELEVKTRIIFPKNSRQRGRKQNAFITMKLIARYSELFNLYNTITNNQNKILTYLHALED